ncbi:Putative pentatricopeptide repeat-containing protein At1g13800 [Linum grandiflorum]
MMKNDDEIEPTSDTYCIIIEGLCKAGKLEDAEGFYSEYLEKDGSSLDICNAMVNGYCSTKSVEKAFELFVSVSKQGRILKKKTCLKLLSMLVDEDDKCLQLVEMVLNLEADYAHVLCRRAIFVLSRAGKMEMAAFVLLRLNRSIDVATYTMMIQGYCGVQRLREAEEDLNEMKIRGGNDELGEAEEVLNEMRNRGAERLLEGAFKVLKEMKNRGVEPDIVTYTSLLDGLLKRYPEGKQKEEFKNDIIREIMERKEVEPDAVYYTVLIDGSGRAGYIERGSTTVPPPKHIERAKEHFKEMIDRGVEPDIVAYTALFFGLLRAGDIQSVRDLGNKMSEQLTLDSSFYEVLKYGSTKAEK